MKHGVLWFLIKLKPGIARGLRFLVGFKGFACMKWSFCLEFYLGFETLVE
jgi:hypothetical protein